MINLRDVKKEYGEHNKKSKNDWFQSDLVYNGFPT